MTPNDFKIGDKARVTLSREDPLYAAYSGSEVRVLGFSGANVVINNSFGTITVSRDELTPIVCPTPPVTALPPRKDFHYTIELDQRGYVELTQLILKHGLAHEGGYKLSQFTVDAVSGAETSFR